MSGKRKPRNRNSRVDWDPKIDLQLVSTSADKFVFVTAGPVRKKKIDKLEDLRLDQAPFQDSRGNFTGIITTRSLAALHQRGDALSGDDPDIQRCFLPQFSKITTILGQLSKFRAFLARSSESGSVIGMFTLSDLDRHQFRHYLYPPLAKLEEVVAYAFSSKYDKSPHAWLMKLSKNDQKQIEKYYKRAEECGVELSQVSGADLGQMLKALIEMPDLISELSLTGTSWESRIQGIICLRNKIMHLTKPMACVESETDDVRLAVIHTKEHAYPISYRGHYLAYVFA